MKKGNGHGHPALRPGLEVYFKHEDHDKDGNEIGPITVIDPKERDADPQYHPILGVPSDYDPPWLAELGWDTADEAERVANFCGTSVHYE